MMKNLSSDVTGRGIITVLAVTPDSADRRSLEEVLNSGRCEIRGASSCREALHSMRNDTPTVVVCEQNLPDGNWRDLFSLMNNLSDRPPIVVMSRHADERLWAEVLNLGGFDVLAKPLERKEVSRVFEMASRYGRALQPA